MVGHSTFVCQAKREHVLNLRRPLERINALPTPMQHSVMEVIEAMLVQASQ